MSEYRKTNYLGTSTPVLVTENPDDMLVTNYEDSISYVKTAEADFMKKKDEFFNHSVRDIALEDAAKAWEKAGVIMICYAATLFNMDAKNIKLRRYALELMDKAAKASSTRLNNLIRHREKLMADKPDDKVEEERLTQIKYEADHSFFRCIHTHQHYLELFAKGGCYEAEKHDADKKMAARVEEMRKMIPADHIYIPGRIYPPIPIPAGKRVPRHPEPYRRYKLAPVEALQFDKELDEFVIKPGYVSEDGLIDDQSVVWDRENHQVIMKFRGGEPIVWPEWKATWTGDMPKAGSWIAEYYMRLGMQNKLDGLMTVLTPQPYEDDPPDFGKPPGV